MTKKSRIYSIKWLTGKWLSIQPSLLFRGRLMMSDFGSWRSEKWEIFLLGVDSVSNLICTLVEGCKVTPLNVRAWMMMMMFTFFHDAGIQLWKFGEKFYKVVRKFWWYFERVLREIEDSLKKFLIKGGGIFFSWHNNVQNNKNAVRWCKETQKKNRSYLSQLLIKLIISMIITKSISVCTHQD